ncbi:MAG: phytoene/squalene synthase family protein [Deltaproteobacteria bacterium]|nr:phytoene/squalene synthase family protein [Deltaproteobacteria bacterium]
MTPEATLAKGSRSFSLAAQFLPARTRSDAAVVYSLCRLIDDEADATTDVEQARRSLLALAQELSGQAPARPLVAEFLRVMERRRIDRRHALELIEGALSDLSSVRVNNEGELIRYAYRVAGTVGLMMSGVIGADHPQAPPFAIDLGVAMQLTNIARDVKEDAALGRVYLPATWLAEFGHSAESLLAAQIPAEHLSVVVRRLLNLAEVYYRSADQGLRYIPLRTRVGILVASRVYRGIGRLLLQRGANPLQGRTVVSPIWRLCTAGLALFELIRPSILGLTPGPPHQPALHSPIGHLPGANTGAQEPGWLGAGE